MEKGSSGAVQKMELLARCPDILLAWAAGTLPGSQDEKFILYIPTATALYEHGTGNLCAQSRESGDCPRL